MFRKSMWFGRIVRPLLVLCLVPFLAYGQATVPAKLSAAEIDLADRIKADSIREKVAALSADDMQGRGTMQPGGDKAAQYIADQFAKLKLAPLGDKGTYLQAVKFWEYSWQPETTLKVGDETFKLGTDYAPLPLYGEDKNRSGDLVFVAYGMQTERPKRDDLTGINLNGQIAVLLDGPPPSVTKEAWASSHLGEQILISLVQQGAVGVIIVHNDQDEHSFSEAADYLTRRQISPAEDAGMYAAVPPLFIVNQGAAEKLFAKSNRSWQQAKAQADGPDFKPYSMKVGGKMVTKAKTAKGTGSNVVGVLEGSDPKLKDEAIVYSAHYDAFGTAADGRIYHGAADNGLGVGEMLAVAEAFTSAPEKPRRSIIFLAVTGEEYEDLGSEYWAHNPTWKIKQVAADLNLDGMGTEVYGPVKTIVGFGAEHSTLGPALIDVVSADNLSIIRDPMPEEKAFYRSDHYAFVKKGVPGIMLMGAPAGDTKVWMDRMKAWEKSGYHQPGDVIKPDWNWEGPRTVAVVMAHLGWRTANADAMPSWVEKSPFNRERGTNLPAPPEP
jgi:hypothetical protein